VKYVEGYRERRRAKLLNQAKEAARKVKQREKPVVLEPMHAADRRTVHIALRDDPLIETTSINENRDTGMKSVRISLRKRPPRPPMTEPPISQEQSEMPEEHEEPESPEQEF